MTRAPTSPLQTSPLTEKERRAQALQKALRDNLRRRKIATADEAGAQTVQEPENDAPEKGLEPRMDTNEHE